MITDGKDAAAIVHESCESREFGLVRDRGNLSGSKIGLVKACRAVADSDLVEVSEAPLGKAKILEIRRGRCAVVGYRIGLAVRLDDVGIELAEKMGEGEKIEVGYVRGGRERNAK